MRQSPASETTISKNWSWLESKKLVRSERHHRVRRIYMTKEDGSGTDYSRPRGEPRGFLSFPFAYFVDRWHKEIGLAGKVVLLIALSQKPIFTLVTERAADWYGVSPDTLQRGLQDLRDHGLLETWAVGRKTPRARTGLTMVHHHRLTSPLRREK